jgi:hypothetical protein
MAGRARDASFCGLANPILARKIRLYKAVVVVFSVIELDV